MQPNNMHTSRGDGTWQSGLDVSQVLHRDQPRAASILPAEVNMAPVSATEISPRERTFYSAVWHTGPRLWPSVSTSSYVWRSWRCCVESLPASLLLLWLFHSTKYRLGFSCTSLRTLMGRNLYSLEPNLESASCRWASF